MFKTSLQEPSRPAPEFKPYLQSPLHSFDLASKVRPQDGTHGAWMNEVPLLGYILIRGNAADGAFSTAVNSVLGVLPPTRPTSLVCASQGVLIWQSPDEWLFVCARTQLRHFMASLETATGHLFAQVMDNSGGLTQVYLAGAKHIDVLRHVGVYDFSAITEGRAVGTVCAKANILVYRVDSNGVFVIFRRSFADYLWLLLNKAARPYGLGIVELRQRADHPVLSLL